MLTARPPCQSAPSIRWRGLSLVELLVAITVGLFIVLGATMMILPVTQTTASTSQATKMNTDARAALDIIANELRRAGYGISTPEAIYPGTSGACVVYAYRDTPTSVTLWGRFVHDDAAQLIRAQYNSATPLSCDPPTTPLPPPLTDPKTMRVRSFAVRCLTDANGVQITAEFSQPDHATPQLSLTTTVHSRNGSCRLP
ncbi:hypothetical protein Tsedi_01506 [Tepidimonas sediminis]|uniref:Prepilin-type N-terminal cleavage/methylation domain-containing protein n=1 Tax=Tepidimonas sediminis TaxID=2588941 RepID=A0A554WNW2_9BURK|nr:hypothetical protein [Tepidimonas sediminis]TSE25259.1 hypothetical protein Tsedi_01506 [Tepidimonas sediminis]